MDERDYLSHHGILGQKWGQQNGPPYPLASGARSALEKAKAGIKAGAKAVKSYNIKRKRKASLEKARAAKAEKKKQEEKIANKEAKAKKRDERIQKFIDSANKVDNVTKAAEKYADSWNRTIKLANPFIKKLTGKALPKIGIDNETEQMIDALIKSGDAKGIWANRTKFSDTQISVATTRLKNYQKLQDAAEGKKIKDN